MALQVELKASLITDAIREDRTELRQIRDRIYSLVSFITTASFALTSFFFAPNAGGSAINVSRTQLLYILVDAGLLVLLWVLFLGLLRDLKIGQLCLEAREKILRSLTQETDADKLFDVYPKVDIARAPKISHNNLFWLAGAATIAILIKLITVLWLTAT